MLARGVKVGSGICLVMYVLFLFGNNNRRSNNNKQLGVMVKAWIREVSRFVFLLLKIGGCRFESFLHKSVVSKKTQRIESRG
ncbi:hypothetical protein VTJ04DRAFT_244 [Mycothermus thermophilus]|uniref:uncharacterized protein n=1 Tax=Humicola insolens TaxID=85995 RepID=UPI0037434F2A